MAMTNAEKQRAYRERHLGVDGEKARVQLILSAGTKEQLARLARHNGYSLAALVEELATKAEQRTVNRMTPREQRDYFDRGPGLMPA
jgi:hypothetical protein